MVRITIELADQQAEALQAMASRVGVAPDKLAEAAVSDLLGQPDASFEAAAEHVVAKNAELYKRLA